VEFLRSPNSSFPPGCDVDPAPVTVSSLPHSRSPLLQFIATAASAPARWPPATSLSPRHGSRRPATSREFIPFPVLDLLYFCSSWLIVAWFLWSALPLPLSILDLLCFCIS
jgi:hypothetical protein